MRLNSPWQPRLAEGIGSPTDRLVEALSADLLDGRLESGARLPAHRDLAYRLGIGLGTVTKAYAVLERRGLVRSVKGRGTFAAIAEARRGPLINLSENAPPPVLKERLLVRTLSALSKRLDARLFNAYPPLGGYDEHRRQMARWFAGLGVEVDVDQLLLTAGAQHGLSVAFSTACGPQGTLYAEAQTYSRAIGLARYQGLRLEGLAMDNEGLLPDALDAALGRHTGGQAAIYVTPTMQNPTTSTMTKGRRQEIVRICRAHDAWIIEDDVYTLRADPELPALASLAPERTIYVNSLSKTVTPTLRAGATVFPVPLLERAKAVLGVTSLTVSSMSCAVMEQWLLDGTAEAIRQSVNDEAKRRMALARSMLGAAIVPARQDGHHVWLPMSRQDAERCELAARALGISVTPPAASVAGPDVANHGVRLCIGATSFSELSTGLSAISGILARLRDVGTAASDATPPGRGTA